MKSNTVEEFKHDSSLADIDLRQKKKLRFSWIGGLAEFRDEYTSVELQEIVSENLGFDVRSTDSSGMKRYIEVKARSGLGAVALTQNEWFKAKQFKSEYFLYVVLNAGTEPNLYIIQNPSEQTHPEEQIEVVRHLISLDQIQGIGVKCTEESRGS